MGLPTIEDSAIMPPPLRLRVFLLIPFSLMHKNLFDLTGRRILISGSREVAKRMIQKRAGKIINICSLMSDIGRRADGVNRKNWLVPQYLSSTGSDFVNGQMIYVDGGMISVL
jgi:hypothetical protein